VVKVEDLDGGGEVESCVFPDPRGTVAKEDDDSGLGESAPDGFGAELLSTGAAVAQGADIAGGAGVAHGVPILVGGRLGEDAAELGLAGAGGTVGLFTLPSAEFFAADGNACAVVFHIEDGNGLGIGGWFKSGQGSAQLRGEAVDETVEGARFEFKTGEGVEDGGSFLIGVAGVGGCLADELSHRRGVMFNKIQGEVERRTSAATLGMMEVTAFDNNRTKQCLDVDRAVVVDGFAGKWRGVVGDELAVVVEFFDDAAGIAGEGVPQLGFEPLGQRLPFLLVVEFLTRLGEKEFRFAVFFGEALGLEVFFSAVCGAALAAARFERLCWMAAAASWDVICSNRFPFSRSWRSDSSCSAGI